MELKKYRVQKADGTQVIIEAENIDKAITIAKSKFGQLPNEINAKIIEGILSKLSVFCENLSVSISNIREDKRSLDWGTLYDKLNTISDDLNNTGEEVRDSLNSMVKLRKDN